MQLYHEAYVLDVHTGVSSFLPEELGTHAAYIRGKKARKYTYISVSCHRLKLNSIQSPFTVDAK
jgi:hypothetical protein